MLDPDNCYVMRFEDGPLSRRHNIKTLAGTSGNTAVPRDLFGWPLPNRLGVLSHPGVRDAGTALWDADDPKAANLPSVITESPNAVVYRKVSESQIKQDLPGVVRGALYRLERDER